MRSRSAARSTGGSCAPGRCVERLRALQHLALKRFGKPAVRLAEIAAKQLHHGFGESDLRLRVEHLLFREAARDHEQRHVAHDLGGGRDLHDVAEHLVHVGVGLRHFRPARVVDAERARLLAQVRVLAAGHAVHVDIGGAGANVALERRVEPAHLLPVRRDHAQVRGIDAGVARAVAQRLDDRAEVRLRGEAAHGIHRAIDGIRAGVDGGEHACRGDAAGVVRVEVHRQADLLLQRLHQRVCGARPAQARHVLDAEDVRARRLQLARHLQVVVERVLLLVRVAQVAGVADGRLAQLARLAARRRWRRACSPPS